MATVACGAVGAAVGGCVALVLALPAFALKEIYEGRTNANIKRHLGRRRKCRVNFDMNALLAASVCKSSSSSTSCNPPDYAALFGEQFSAPPPSYAAVPLRSALKKR